MRAIDSLIYAIAIVLASYALLRASVWTIDVAHAYDFAEQYAKMVGVVVVVLLLAAFIYCFAHDLPRGWRP